MDLRETEKKQGIKLQIKQKQTRSPKKRRSLVSQGQTQKRVGAANERRKTRESITARTSTNQQRETAKMWFKYPASKAGIHTLARNPRIARIQSLRGAYIN